MDLWSNIFLLSFFSTLYAVSFSCLTQALGKQLPPIKTSADISELATKARPSLVTVIAYGEGDQPLKESGREGLRSFESSAKEECHTSNDLRQSSLSAQSSTLS